MLYFRINGFLSQLIAVPYAEGIVSSEQYIVLIYWENWNGMKFNNACFSLERLEDKPSCHSLGSSELEVSEDRKNL